MKPREIELLIEELMLDGITPTDAQRVGAAVERELSRLLAGRGMPAHLHHARALERIDAGVFARPLSATPPTIGGEIARAVYGGLERSARGTSPVLGGEIALAVYEGGQE